MKLLQRTSIGLLLLICAFCIWVAFVLTGPRREAYGLFLEINPLFFEPEVTEDFAHGVRGLPKIPHIIHQTYKDELVPVSSMPLIKSLVKFNPNWTYFFWTDKSARKLLEDKYQFFLPLWDTYEKAVYRADALRYFVLYEYGGVYADIDVECLRPLDTVTTKYPAIFPLEPFEHAVFRTLEPFLVNNAIMMARPKHPFLRRMLVQLQEYAQKNNTKDGPGPFFVTDVFKQYYSISKANKNRLLYEKQSKSQEPYFYKALPKVKEDDSVYIPNTHFFMNKLAENFEVEEYKRICKLWHQGKRVSCGNWINTSNRMCGIPTELGKRACNELYRRDNRTLENQFRFTFTKHHWFSTWFKTKIQLNSTVDIRTVVPAAKFYN